MVKSENKVSILTDKTIIKSVFFTMREPPKKRKMSIKLRNYTKPIFRFV